MSETQITRKDVVDVKSTTKASPSVSATNVAAPIAKAASGKTEDAAASAATKKAIRVLDSIVPTVAEKKAGITRTPPPLPKEVRKEDVSPKTPSKGEMEDAIRRWSSSGDPQKVAEDSRRASATDMSIFPKESNAHDVVKTVEVRRETQTAGGRVLGAARAFISRVGWKKEVRKSFGNSTDYVMTESDYDLESQIGMDIAMESEESDPSERFCYDTFAATGVGSTRTRRGLVDSLNRAIDHSFGTAMTFLGGGKIVCEGSYVRSAWEIGDNAPQFAKFDANGELRTFVITGWKTLDTKKHSYRILRKSEVVDEDGWTVFFASCNRKVLLKNEVGEKLRYVKLTNVAEFDGLSMYVTRHDFDPFVEGEKVAFREPETERVWIENQLANAKKENRVCQIRFYDLPLSWLREEDTSPEMKELIMSQCPPTSRDAVDFKDDHELVSYYGAGLRRSILDLEKTAKKREDGEALWLPSPETLAEEKETLKRLKALLRGLEAGPGATETLKALNLLKSAFAEDSVDEVLARSKFESDTSLFIAPSQPPPDHALPYTGFRSVDFDFEGLEFTLECQHRGSFRLLTANEISMKGISASLRTLLQSVAAESVSELIICRHVEFEYDVESSVRSISTNQLKREHGSHAFGQIWQERVAYSGTYRGVWFFGGRTSRVLNNQLFAELIHGECDPISIYHTNRINRLKPLDFDGKSVYFDSFDLDEFGSPRQTACHGYGSEHPISGLGRKFPPNLSTIMGKFPVEMKGEFPMVTVSSGGKTVKHPYEVPWVLSRFDPERDPLTNVEAMLSFRKEDSGVSKLLRDAPSTKVEAPSEKKPTNPEGREEVSGKRATKAPTPDFKKKIAPVLSARKPPKKEDEDSVVSEAITTMRWKTPKEESKGKVIDDHSRVDKLLKGRSVWLAKVRQEHSRAHSWSEVCSRARIEGKNKADLESDLFDFIRKKPTQRVGIEKISDSVWKFFLALKPDVVESNLTPFDRRRKGHVPTEFLVDYE